MNQERYGSFRRRSAIHSAALLLAMAPLAQAETFYVDSKLGNDRWSGRLATRNSAAATDGPWQSLSRVATATLAAGDSVLLKCGGKWSETLTLPTGGRVGAPSLVGSYPELCPSPPAIDGAIPIPADQWTRHAGNVYRATLPIDSILNSTFESGPQNWHHWSPSGGQTLRSVAQCLGNSSACMEARSSNSYALFNSNTFSLSAGTANRVEFRVNLPVGRSIKVVIRRSETPWDEIGVNSTIAGTGTWQQVTLPFVASASVPNARLEFGVAAGGVNVLLDDVHVVPEGTVIAPLQVSIDGIPHAIAHHPNRGHDQLRPDSPYLSSSVNADRLGYGTNPGSSYLPFGNELSLPAGAVLTPDVGVRLRTNAWTIEERIIQSVTPGRAHFDKPTKFQFLRGWGYFLTNALWMLDQPGEWYFSPAQKALYVWMPDGQAPADRVSVSTLATGIDLTRLSNVIVDKLDIRHAKVGARLQDTTGLVFTNNRIQDTVEQGIILDGSQNGRISGNILERIGSDGILSLNSWTRTTFGIVIERNELNGIGVIRENGRPESLPTPAFAGIRASNAAVRKNVIDDTAYVGILPSLGSRVEGNSISNTCLMLDDCGGIYVSGSNNNSTLADNVIVNVIGGLEGKPHGSATQSQGIYLDEHAAGVQVLRNTVTNADNGIQIHNAANNRIEANTLYGNRKYQIWVQENSNDLRPTGNVFNNAIIANKLFPTSPGPALHGDTIYSSTTSFGTFDHNRYSTLLETVIASEKWSAAGASYTFPEWRAARAGDNSLRNLDPNGSVVAQIGYAPFRITGSTIIPNGTLSAGLAGWHGWNEIVPSFTMLLRTGCSTGTCIEFTAGGSFSILSSPNFSVNQGQLYRLSFDLRAGAVGQNISVRLRRGAGGPAPYEVLAPAISVAPGTAWKRYSMIFQASKTAIANDPVTREQGARIDIQVSSARQSVSVANMEMAPLSPAQASLTTRLVVNGGETTAALPCPDAATNAAICSQYIKFSDGQIAVWPLQLLPSASEIVFSRDRTLTDADGDSIADYQDLCAGTPLGQSVNSKGC